MILESIILPALVPAAIDMVRTTVNRIVGVKAQTVDEVIQLRNSEVEKLKALAEMDNPGGTPSQWVIDLRGSFRYLLAGVTITAAVTTLYVPGVPEVLFDYSWQAASAVFSFLFGEHIMLRIKNKE
jgi:hypothetical protein